MKKRHAININISNNINNTTNNNNIWTMMTKGKFCCKEVITGNWTTQVVVHSFIYPYLSVPTFPCLSISIPTK